MSVTIARSAIAASSRTALTGGHCRIGDSVFLSGNCGVHQFTRIGRLAVLGAVSVSTKDIPPFIIQERINTVVGLNLVGMRRSQIPRDAVEAVRQAYDIIFRQRQILSVALALLEKEFGHVPPVVEMVTFIRQSSAGYEGVHGWRVYIQELAPCRDSSLSHVKLEVPCGGERGHHNRKPSGRPCQIGSR
jgi:acyl-[acyl carrier protein]--UDP-N-acetylglucosamine O-acyltransferase